MGTHISKVKSVDLDVWTPEQMASIQKWGNERANLYWEAHLKPGHQPPDHKMESFIRSKYESKRWAMEGPPPSDPSVLGGSTAAPESSAPAPAQVTPPALPPAPQAAPRPQQHSLLSTSLASRASHPSVPQVSQPRAQIAAPAAPATTTAPSAAQNDLFSLDFHAPISSPPEPKNTKSDILSLFSTGNTGGPANFSGFGQPAQPQGAQTTSMMGSTGVGMWGVQSGWTPQQQQQQQPANDIWGNFGSAPQQPAPSNSLFGTQDPWGNQPAKAPAAADPFGNVWGAPATGASTGAGTDLFGQQFSAAPAAKKDDAFGDLWGGFK
ncbi:hypothetical protein CTheo_2996 [Ceratobasidium theobromae]|uniref:Arf-GAP domain-containing protein n=1 Tax=Ceratobasidium theobromae TaxID=1582974 RepID=A0A5N5QP40_9AGAM|nr:hypothetical protein CTheo_2996 [Ceratobasidium theobromae]